MIPENWTPILEHLDRRFDDQNKLIESKFQTSDVKIDSVCRDVDEIKSKKESDHEKIEQKIKSQLEPKIDLILQIITEVRKDMDARFNDTEKKVEKQFAEVHKRIDTTNERVATIERYSGERAKSLIDKIRNNALTWLVPALIIAFMYLVMNYKTIMHIVP